MKKQRFQPKGGLHRGPKNEVSTKEPNSWRIAAQRDKETVPELSGLKRTLRAQRAKN